MSRPRTPVSRRRRGEVAHERLSRHGEAVALELMRIIDEAENKDGRRQRINLSERERLLRLHQDCLTAVTGLDCARPITMH